MPRRSGRASTDSDARQTPRLQFRPGRLPAGWQWFLGIEASGVGALHYAWEKDGVPVGADAPMYMLARVSPSDAGVYRCLVSDIRGASFSDPATIEVDESNPVPAVNAAGFFAVAATLAALGLRRVR